MALRLLTPVIKNSSNFNYELFQKGTISLSKSPVRRIQVRRGTNDVTRQQKMHNVVACLGLSRLLSTFKKRVKLDGTIRAAQIRFISKDKKDDPLYTPTKGFDASAFRKRNAPYVNDTVSPFRPLYPCKNYALPNDLASLAQKIAEKRRPVVTVSKIQEKINTQRFNVAKEGYLKGVRWPPLYKFKGNVNTTPRVSRDVDKNHRIMLKPLYSSKHDPGALTFLRNSEKHSYSQKSIQSRNYQTTKSGRPFRNSRSLHSQQVDRSRVNGGVVRKNALREEVLFLQTNVQSEIEMLKWKINQMNSKKKLSFQSYSPVRKHETSVDESSLKTLEELAENVKAIQREVKLLKMIPPVGNKKDSPSTGHSNKKVELKDNPDKITASDSPSKEMPKSANDDFNSFKEALLEQIEKTRASEGDFRIKKRQIVKSKENVQPKEVITFPRDKRSLLQSNELEINSMRRNFSSLAAKTDKVERNCSPKNEKGFLETVKTLFFPFRVEPSMRKLKQKESIKDDATVPKDPVSLTESQQVVENKMKSDDKTSTKTSSLVSLNSKGEKSELSPNDAILAKINKFREDCEVFSCYRESKRVFNEEEITMPPLENTANSVNSISDDTLDINSNLRNAPPVTSAVMRSIQNFKVPLKAQIAEFRKQRDVNDQRQCLLPLNRIRPQGVSSRMGERKLLAAQSLEMTKKSGLHTKSRSRNNVKIRSSSIDAYRPLYPFKGITETDKQEVKLDKTKHQMNSVRFGFQGAPKTDVIRLKKLIMKKTKSDPMFQPISKTAEPELFKPTSGTVVKTEKNAEVAPIEKEEAGGSLTSIIKESGLESQVFSLVVPAKAMTPSMILWQWTVHYSGAKQFKIEDLEEDYEVPTRQEICSNVTINTSKDSSVQLTVPQSQTPEMVKDWSDLDAYDFSDSLFKRVSYQKFVNRVEHLSWLISKDQIDKIHPEGDSWESEIVEEKILESELNALVRLPVRPFSENGYENNREFVSRLSNIDYSLRLNEQEEPPADVPVKMEFFDFSDSFSTRVRQKRIRGLKLPKNLSRNCEKTWFTEDDN